MTSTVPFCTAGRRSDRLSSSTSCSWTRCPLLAWRRTACCQARRRSLDAGRQETGVGGRRQGGSAGGSRRTAHRTMDGVAVEIREGEVSPDCPQAQLPPSAMHPAEVQQQREHDQAHVSRGVGVWRSSCRSKSSSWQVPVARTSGPSERGTRPLPASDLGVSERTHKFRGRQLTSLRVGWRPPAGDAR